MYFFVFFCICVCLSFLYFMCYACMCVSCVHVCMFVCYLCMYMYVVFRRFPPLEEVFSYFSFPFFLLHFWISHWHTCIAVSESWRVKIYFQSSMCNVCVLHINIPYMRYTFTYTSIFIYTRTFDMDILLHLPPLCFPFFCRWCSWWRNFWLEEKDDMSHCMYILWPWAPLCCDSLSWTVHLCEVSGL